MNKMRNLISILFGLLALAALAAGLAWLFGTQGVLQGQQVSPLPTPTLIPMETPTPTMYVEPTAPSEDWPTLTPYPTQPWPTHGPPAVKPTPFPTPMPTPLPSLPLPPIPEGKPPEDLWSILYLPLEDELAVHGVLVDAHGRRWSDPQIVYDFRKIESGPHTCLTKLDVAPTGDWLAVVVTYFEGGQTWLLDLASQEPHPVSACEGYFFCSVRDWSPDGKVIILARNRGDFNPSGFVTVDVASDTMTDLRVPKTTLDRPYVREAAFSPDGRSIAWTIEDDGPSETTQVWLTDSKGEQGQLLTSEAGRIWNLAWHPDGSQIAYSLAVGKQRGNIWLLSIESRESVLLVPSPDSFSNPVWSPDGLQAAMTQCADAPDKATLVDQKCNISVLDCRNGLISPVVVHPGRVYWDVSWSPDAKTLAFLSANDKDLQAVWLFSSETDSTCPISGYLRPFSEYDWLPYGFAGEQ